jgi:hypothetical protein
MPRSAAAELAAPYRDPKTGRFGAGNPGARLRQVAALGRAEAESLLRLPVDEVAPWLRSHLETAQRHAQQLVDSLAVPTPELVALCGDEAKCRLLAAACLTEGSRVGCDPKSAAAWREESRAWLREARQCVLTRKGVARDTPKAAHNPLLAAIEAAGSEAAE